MKKKLFALVMSFFVIQIGQSNGSASEVTVPLSTYLELIEKQKTAPVTVIEEVTLKGDYRKSNFQVSIKGKAVSPWKDENVLGQFEGNIRGCNGNAILNFTEGNYKILPQGSNFQLTCTLIPKNRNVALSILNAMYFESKIENAETNIATETAQYRNITIFEKARETEQRQKGELTARANYKLTVLPDTSKFDYVFVINNPNRISEKYDIAWSNSEVIETITTNLKYQEQNQSLSITIPSGSHTVYVRGKIAGQSFRPLLKSEEQYLLIQNHPLMQVQPTTNWRRIATSESSISQDYNSARAFLIDPKEAFEWSAKKLQAFSALGYTLKNAHYLYYLPRNGKAIVEATYQISNQGTPEIALNVPGKVLYMAVDGQASPLYKDEKNQLLATISSGDHNLVIQYQPDLPERTVASFNRSELLKPNAVVSQSSMTLRHDRSWNMLAGRFGEDFITHVHPSDIVFAFLIAAMIFFLFKKLFRFEDKKLLYAFSGLLGALTLFDGLYTFFIFVIAIGLVSWRFRDFFAALFKRALTIKFNLLRTVGMIFLLLIGLWAVSFIFTQGAKMVNRVASVDAEVGHFAEKSYPAQSPVAAYEQESDSGMAGADNGNAHMAALSGGGRNRSEGMSSLLAKGKGARGNSPMQAGVADSYEGLPAKVQIPSDGKNVYFNLSLIDADKTLRMGAFFINNLFVRLLDAALFIALIWLVYRHRMLFKKSLLVK